MRGYEFLDLLGQVDADLVEQAQNAPRKKKTGRRTALRLVLAAAALTGLTAGAIFRFPNSIPPYMAKLSPRKATQNGSSTYILPYSPSIRSRKMALYIMGNTVPPIIAVATSAKGMAFGVP